MAPQSLQGSSTGPTRNLTTWLSEDLDAAAVVTTHCRLLYSVQGFCGGGTLLVAYTNSKLLSNTDTLTSWLENGGNATGGVGQVQDWNNLEGERSFLPKMFRNG